MVNCVQKYSLLYTWNVSKCISNDFEWQNAFYWNLEQGFFPTVIQPIEYEDTNVLFNHNTLLTYVTGYTCTCVFWYTKIQSTLLLLKW